MSKLQNVTLMTSKILNVVRYLRGNMDDVLCVTEMDIIRDYMLVYGFMIWIEVVFVDV